MRLPSQIYCGQVLVPSLLQIPAIGEEVGAVDRRHCESWSRIVLTKHFRTRVQEQTVSASVCIC